MSAIVLASVRLEGSRLCQFDTVCRIYGQTWVGMGP